MPDLTLTCRSILEPTLAELARQGSDQLHLAELPLSTRVVIRALEPIQTFQHVLQPILGTGLDDRPNRVSHGRDCRVFWLRVNQWLVIAEPARGHELVNQLNQALADFDSSVVDVSDYFTTLRLTGPKSLEVLMKGCPFDLHPSAFPTGAMAMTCLAQTDVLLYHRAVDCLDVVVRTSFAEYALRWLHDAGLEYDITVRAAPDSLTDPVVHGAKS